MQPLFNCCGDQISRRTVAIDQDAPHLVMDRREGVQNRFIVGTTWSLKAENFIYLVGIRVEPKRIVIVKVQIFAVALLPEPVNNLRKSVG